MKQPFKTVLILALVLMLVSAATMLAACGKGGKSGNDDAATAEGATGAPSQESTAPPSGSESGTGSSGQQTEKVIKGSDLVTKEDAERILGETVELAEDHEDVTMGVVQRVYYATQNCVLQVGIEQDSPAHVELTRKTYDNDESTILVEGIGDWARIGGMSGTLLYITEGDCIIIINVDNRNEENSWKTEKLKETGKLAVERLDAIME